MGLLYFLGSGQESHPHPGNEAPTHRDTRGVARSDQPARVLNWRRAGRPAGRDRDDEREQLARQKKRQGDGRWLHRQAGEHRHTATGYGQCPVHMQAGREGPLQLAVAGGRGRGRASLMRGAEAGRGNLVLPRTGRALRAGGPGAA